MKRKNKQSNSRKIKRHGISTGSFRKPNNNIKKEKMKKDYLRILIGVLLMPIFYALYLCDRACSSFNPFIDLPKFKHWLTESKQVTYSFLRNIIYSIIIFVIWLIN